MFKLSYTFFIILINRICVYAVWSCIIIPSLVISYSSSLHFQILKDFSWDTSRRDVLPRSPRKTEIQKHPVDPSDSFQQNHQGNASCTSFYLFFSGTFLFTMAGTLLSTGAWCFLVRLPMIHLVRGPSRIIVVLSGYIFAAGALTLLTSCILYREHNVTRGRRRTLLPVSSFIYNNYKSLRLRNRVRRCN